MLTSFLQMRTNCSGEAELSVSLLMKWRAPLKLKNSWAIKRSIKFLVHTCDSDTEYLSKRSC